MYENDSKGSSLPKRPSVSEINETMLRVYAAHIKNRTHGNWLCNNQLFRFLRKHWRLLKKEIVYSCKSKVNNHLLLDSKSYFVWLKSTKPFIIIDDVRYELYLTRELGLDVDGDCVRVWRINDSLCVTSMIPQGFSKICVGNKIEDPVGEKHE